MRSGLVASPFGEGERMKVRGWICRAAALVCLDATLTLPLSLGKGEATHARTMSSVHQKSLSCLGDLNMTGHSCDDFLAFQIFIEPRDRLIHSIDLMLRLDEEMAFAGINDELCRHAERF
jgi:hypothetical protein